MKTKYIFVMLLIFLCATQAIEAGEVSTNLGTLDYEETIEVDIDGDGMTNLAYITSDFDKKTLSYSITGYDNNTTAYEFTSNTVKIFPYTFEPGVKNYYFHDEKTGNVYKVSIDFSGVEVPGNPYVQQIATLQEANDNKTQRILDMQEEIATLEEEVVIAKNKTQATQQEVLNLSGQLSNLQANYETLEEERDQFEQELEGWPYTALVIILIMTVVIYLLVHLILTRRFQKKSSVTIENDTNYTPLMRKFDTFAKKFFRKEAKKAKEGKTISLDKVNQQYAQEEPEAEPLQPPTPQPQQAPKRQPLKIGKSQEKEQIPREEKSQIVNQQNNTQEIVDGFRNELFSKIDELNERVDRAEARRRGVTNEE